jgi:hypothetical protein
MDPEDHNEIRVHSFSVEDAESQQPTPADSTTQIRIYPNDQVEAITTPHSTPQVRLWPMRWQRITEPIRRVSSSVWRWIEGPQPPQIQRISPVFPRLQTAPIRVLNKLLPKRKHRVLLLLAFYFCWTVTFGAVLRLSTASVEIEGYGHPTQISCLASYW